MNGIYPAIVALKDHVCLYVAVRDDDGRITGWVCLGCGGSR